MTKCYLVKWNYSKSKECYDIAFLPYSSNVIYENVTTTLQICIFSKCIPVKWNLVCLLLGLIAKGLKSQPNID